MKSSFFFPYLAVQLPLLLSPFSTAQDLSSLPSCAQTPALAALGNTGCRSSDFACICQNSDFINTALEGARSVCSEGDLGRVLAFAQQLCSTVGVTISATTSTSSPASSPASISQSTSQSTFQSIVPSTLNTTVLSTTQSVVSATATSSAGRTTLQSTAAAATAATTSTSTSFAARGMEVEVGLKFVMGILMVLCPWVGMA